MERASSREDRREVVRAVIQRTELPRAMVARLAEVNESTVWAWLRPPEGGAARSPSVESVARLSEGLRAYGKALQELADQLPTE